MGFDQIQYRVQTFKLARMYEDWEDYKADPKLDPAQAAAAQRAVERAALPLTCTSRSELIKITHDLMFPGFGMAVFGERVQADGSLLAGCAVTLPLADKDRVVVYRGRDDAWTLADDFVWSPGQAIMGVHDGDGTLVYTGFTGNVVVVRTGQRAS